MSVEEELRRAAVTVPPTLTGSTAIWTDIERRAEALRRRRTMQRAGLLAAAITALTAVAVAGALLGRSSHRLVTSRRAAASQQTGWRVFTTGPLSPRSDEVQAWTGHELILWGGSTSGRSRALNDGAAFNPQTGVWRRLPPSPLAAREDAIGVWTGSRLLVIAGKSGNSAFVNGAAYDPATNSWRQIAPIPNGAAAPIDPRLVVWTGQQLLLPIAGLGYNPTVNKWSAITPIPANQITFQSAVWTGHEVIVIGIQGAQNSGPTPVVGLAYRPATNQWRRLPPSGMNTAAVAATWDGTRVVVVSDDMTGASYEPTSNTWQSLSRVPLRFYECNPSAFTIAGHAYAQMCSGLAQLSKTGWTPVAYPSSLWGPGPAIPTGNTALMWGSVFPTADSRYRPSPVVEYTPAHDAHREVLVDRALTTLPAGYTIASVDTSSSRTAVPSITAHLSGPNGSCTIASTNIAVADGAATELGHLEQLPGASARRPPPTRFTGGPDFAVEIDPTAHDSEHHLAWATTSTDTIEISCKQPALVQRLTSATRFH